MGSSVVSTMSNWIGTALFLALYGISIGIRIPHDKISKKTKISKTQSGFIEKILLTLMALGNLVLPLLSLSPFLKFANYELRPLNLLVGTISMLGYLWLFYRSHADLGKNWSVTLEIREEHRIVDHGVYRLIRHPMYTAIFLMTVGQIFLVANWIAGPASFFAFALMFAYRIKAEEDMMLKNFGAQYENYRLRTKRIIPGIW
jgi:protein-S-isoprenylcysteine O-methyltransferase Ste14